MKTNHLLAVLFSGQKLTGLANYELIKQAFSRPCNLFVDRLQSNESITQKAYH